VLATLARERRALRSGERIGLWGEVRDRFHGDSDPERGWAWHFPLSSRGREGNSLETEGEETIGEGPGESTKNLKRHGPS